LHGEQERRRCSYRLTRRARGEMLARR